MASSAIIGLSLALALASAGLHTVSSSPAVTQVPIPEWNRIAARGIILSEKRPKLSNIKSVRTLPGITADGKNVPQQTLQVRYSGTKEEIDAGIGKRTVVFPGLTSPNTNSIIPLQTRSTLRTCNVAPPPFRTLPSFEDPGSLANGVVSLLFQRAGSIVGFCSGWLVHERRVVTAAHCIYDLTRRQYYFQRQEVLLVTTGLNGQSDQAINRVGVSSLTLPQRYLQYGAWSQSLADGTDTAVLVLNAPLPGRIYSWSSPAAGSARMVLGYPAVSQTGFDQIGDIGGNAAVPPTYGCIGTGGNILCEDISTEGGHSGSPLFSAYNSDVVVGTLSGGRVDACPSLFTLAVPRLSTTPSLSDLLATTGCVTIGQGVIRVQRC